MDLTPIQQKIFKKLSTAPGQFVPHEQLARAVWPEIAVISNAEHNCLKVHICFLRRRGVEIETAHGVGYRLKG